MRKRRDLSWQVDNLLCLINIHFFNNHIINKVFTLFKFQFTRFISKEFYSFKSLSQKYKNKNKINMKLGKDLVTIYKK